MKKRTVIIIVCLVAVILLIGAIFAARTTVSVYESPTGEYAVIGFAVDEGGFGYGGSFYLKGKGMFSKWHKIGEGAFYCEWKSDEDFIIQFSYPPDGDILHATPDEYIKEYSVYDFIS